MARGRIVRSATGSHGQVSVAGPRPRSRGVGARLRSYSVSRPCQAVVARRCPSSSIAVVLSADGRGRCASMREDGVVLFERSGLAPSVAATARVAPSAHLVGNVRVGAGCVIDHGAVLVSSGPPVVVGAGSVVMANAVIRSAGGSHRPAFPTSIGEDVLVGPLAALVGCTIEDAVYVATGVMVFQDVVVGRGSRLGAGSIAHVGARLAPLSRLGMRQYAVAHEDGAVVTGDLEHARALLAHADFFGRVFAEDERDLESLHRSTVATLRAEAATWSDMAP
jgi:carbonic anhydrase/acetyltransferase-like protein (isoleucine patch superfamily)